MPSERIRILIVDDQALVRKGLVMVLRLEPDFEVVGEAENGETALQMARQLRPHLVLLDLIMPGMSGKETAMRLKTLMPETHILILTGAKLDCEALQVLAAGVDGYILKDVEPDELAQAVRTVAKGEAYLHPTVARRVLDQLTLGQPIAPPIPHHSPLTPRELEVLQLMATPATYREIAEQLFVSEETVRTHAKRILGKLGQPNRVQAVLAAVRAGLIQLHSIE